jgi:hypothetical protein
MCGWRSDDSTTWLLVTDGDGIAQRAGGHDRVLCGDGASKKSGAR